MLPYQKKELCRRKRKKNCADIAITWDNPDEIRKMNQNVQKIYLVMPFLFTISEEYMTTEI